ncbi:hypothetical protein F4809DRAFT_614330 [Biscogniauxia mediterranea]|nr:hypothetical protein F4809DRAFT_614330 [Biscogniauxia mediterranea]
MTSADERPNRWNLGLPFKKCAGPDCIVRTNLQRCGACQVVLYCGVEHQMAHRPQHKSPCKTIKKARENLEREERELRDHPDGINAPENPFVNARAKFWKYTGTRPYMLARDELMMAYLSIRTGEAVQVALGHCLGMLDLCHGDNMGIRNQVPALYLRLGRDQEAFDFIKWWAVGTDREYDWGDPSLPYLDMHDEDAFESPENCLEDTDCELSFKAAMACLKIRLLLDMKMLDRCVKKYGNQDYEKKMEWVRKGAMSDILYKRRDIVEKPDYSEIIAELEDQVSKVCASLKEANQHYLTMLDNPESFIHAEMPSAFATGTREQAIMALRETWYMWSECVPAIKVVKRYK